MRSLLLGDRPLILIGLDIAKQDKMTCKMCVCVCGGGGSATCATVNVLHCACM